MQSLQHHLAGYTNETGTRDLFHLACHEQTRRILFKPPTVLLNIGTQAFHGHESPTSLDRRDESACKVRSIKHEAFFLERVGRFANPLHCNNESKKWPGPIMFTCTTLMLQLYTLVEMQLSSEDNPYESGLLVLDYTPLSKPS